MRHVLCCTRSQISLPVITICGHTTTEESVDTISLSPTSPGKRKEALPLSEHGEKSFVTGKRARLVDKGHCKLNDPSIPHIIVSVDLGILFRGISHMRFFLVRLIVPEFIHSWKK